MADQVNKALGGYGADSRQVDDSPTQKSRASPAGKESPKAPQVQRKKERRPKASTITFNELIKLLIFLLLFAVVVYAMGKGMDPGALIDSVGKALGSFLGSLASPAPLADHTILAGPSPLLLYGLIGLLAFAMAWDQPLRRSHRLWRGRAGDNVGGLPLRPCSGCQQLRQRTFPAPGRDAGRYGEDCRKIR